jgi:hypothetical protein
MSKKRYQYSTDDMEKAVAAVKEGRMIYRKASVQFKIARGTIETHVKDKCATKGLTTVLSRSPIEKDLEEWLLYIYVIEVSPLPNYSCKIVFKTASQRQESSKTTSNSA